MSKNTRISRRDLLALSGALIATSALPRLGIAADKVTEDDATAMALGYRVDAATVDTAKFPKRAGDAGAKQFCENCALYGDQGDGWGTCSIFQGRLVAAKGWCNAWVAG